MSVLRNAALDLLSAAAFLAIWLMRDRFEYDTLRALLFWPVVFEACLAVTLFCVGLAAGLRHPAARVAWMAALSVLYVAGAWLIGAVAGMPHVWLAALWLWLARSWPPRGAPAASPEHLRWLHTGAGYSGLLWGAGFVLTILLMLLVPAPSTVGPDGVVHSVSPAWIFPLVWTPYFIAEGLVRTWRAVRHTPPGSARFGTGTGSRAV